MKGCYYIIFIVCDIIGIISLVCACFSWRQEESTSIIIGMILIPLFVASVFFLPHFLYIKNKLKKRNTDTQSKQKPVDMSKYQVAFSEIPNNPSTKDKKQSDSIKQDCKEKENPIITPTNKPLNHSAESIGHVHQKINQVQEKERLSYIDDMTELLSQTSNSQANTQYDSEHTNICTLFKSDSVLVSLIYIHPSYYIEIANKTNKQIGIIPSFESGDFIDGKTRHLIAPQEIYQLKLDNWKRHDEYGTTTKISFVAYDTSHLQNIILNVSYEFRLQDGNLYYCDNHSEHLAEYHEKRLKDYLFRYLSKTTETLNANEEEFLLDMQPIQYKIVDELGIKKIDWVSQNMSPFYIEIRKLIPMYQLGSEKVIAIYYDKSDDSHNYVKGDKWCFIFKNGEYIELEVQSSPKKVNGAYNRFIVMTLKEDDIDELIKNKLVKIQTKNLDAFDPTVSIKIETPFKQFYFQMIFKAYKQAIQDCGYIWGSEKEVPLEESKSTECYVYIMYDEVNHSHKIGISNHPEYRERTLQSDKPFIVLLKAKKFPSRALAMAFESALHKTYSKKHIRGEWFNLSEDDVKDVITSLN